MDSTDAQGEVKQLNTESNQINVSNRKNQSFYVFLCKKTLEKHETLVLHALGNATSVSVIAAEKLVRNGYAEYSTMETKTIEVDETTRNSRGGGEAREGTGRMVKRAKLLITLKRSADFFENMKKFNEIKDENEKYIESEKQTKESASKD